MANLWSSTSYGFAPVYWLTIGGIPVVFCERATGLTLPTGWTSEDAALVIDDSAEVGVEGIDRERGIGTGLDLTFKLLDTPAVRQWLRRWDNQCTLTQDLMPGDTTVTVDDCSAWGTSGALYLGMERVAFGSRPNSTTFGTLTRGTVGTQIAVHKAGTINQVVTDLPRAFRGREVILWASFADPSGHICGTALDGQESIQVWRGRISGPPERHTDGFSFSSQSIDRLLDQKLAGKMSGDVKGIAPTSLVDASFSFSLALRGVDSNDATIWQCALPCSPFTGLAGQYLSGDERRTKVTAAWSAAVAAVTDPAVALHVGDITWPQVNNAYHATVALMQDAAVYKVTAALLVNGQPMATAPMNYPAGMAAPDQLDLNWDPNAPLFIPLDLISSQAPDGITIHLTEGAAVDVPPTGKVKVTAGSNSCVYDYAATGVDSSGDLHLHQLTATAPQVALSPFTLFDGATAEVLLGDTGYFDVMALRCIESSGMAVGITPGPRGAYDLLARGAGYGIGEDAIDVDSFESMLGQACGTLAGDIAAAGSSFTDLFGGVLGLFRMAVVSRPTMGELNTPVRLAVVYTQQGPDYSCTITDADLLSHAGDPVVSVKRAPTPNVVTVTRQPAGGDPNMVDQLIFNDWAGVDAIGRVEATFRVDAVNRGALQSAALPAVSGHFATDETIQAVNLIVHPGVECETGDAVWLTTTHPAIWSFSTSPGRVGYDGPARVSGKKLCLKTGVVTLELLIDGSLRQNALAPAALVLGYDSPTAPTWIDVPKNYLKHFAAALSATAPIYLWHYQPGRAETSADVLTITGASLVSGNCRLIVSVMTGGTLDVTLHSTLTLPPTGWATTYQKLFAHTGDGSNWG